jgi:hypothetical protein
MIKDFLTTIWSLIKTIILSIIVGIFFEIILSGLWISLHHSTGLNDLQNAFIDNQNHLPGYMVNVFQYLFDKFNSYHSHLNNPLLVLITQSLYLSILIYLEKVFIVFISFFVYLMIMFLFIADGLTAREIRRYRCGEESTRRKLFEGYASCLEYFMFIVYLSIPFYIPAAIWFIVIGCFAASFHRMKYKYIQKYL